VFRKSGNGFLSELCQVSGQHNKIGVALDPAGYCGIVTTHWKEVVKQFDEDLLGLFGHWVYSVYLVHQHGRIRLKISVKGSEIVCRGFRFSFWDLGFFLTQREPLRKTSANGQAEKKWEKDRDKLVVSIMF